MKITSVEVFVFKYDHHYRVGGHTDAPGRLPGTDYYFEPQWKQAYSRLTESCIVKVTTDEGISGWGEAQAPVVPEVAATLIAKLFGPALLNRNPEDAESIYEMFYGFNKARGHVASFTIDAMAALDIALWDIKGKIAGKPVAKLLNPEAKSELKLYVSGLRRASHGERVELAAEIISEGYGGVKIFSGKPPKELLRELPDLRNAVGNDAMFAFDAIGAYNFDDALTVGRELDNLNATWFEAPLDPEDVSAHASLAEKLKTPIAIGETLRTVREFEPWIEKHALKVAQPDIVRCGITGGRLIAESLKDKVSAIAPHIGVCTAIGMAATWHFAAGLQGEHWQEHQFDLFNTGNKVIEEPLVVQKGMAQLSAEPGLGINVNESFVRAHSTDNWLISENT